MTYDEALGFWYGRVNFEVRAAGPGDLKLERMRALLKLLGDPHDRVRLVHVTGTKGKGSTCAMIASVLRAAGYRVGLFTSPHLEVDAVVPEAQRFLVSHRFTAENAENAEKNRVRIGLSSCLSPSFSLCVLCVLRGEIFSPARAGTPVRGAFRTSPG